MSTLQSPLNAAHQHAANADDYSAQGLYIPAAEEHFKAAEAFQACIEASNEENTKRTLRLLYNDHTKAGKELQRKTAKLREENKDPTLPQKPLRSAVSPAASFVPVMPPQSSASPPPLPSQQMTDSQQAVDESFMLLGPKSEGGDAFSHFWRITEGMLDYLSQPVAFATAPLGLEDSKSRRDGSASSDTDVEPGTKRLTRGMNFVKAARSKLVRNDASTASDSDTGSPGITTFPPKPISTKFDDDDWDDDVDADDDHMADSFCLIPSKFEPSSSTLRSENASLKSDIESLQRKLQLAEQTLKQRHEQDQQLRDSILLARKEARAMTSSMAMRPAPPPPVDLASLNINVPPVPPAVAALNPSRDREVQQRKIRELEEEVRALRVENEKQKAMIVRFRERWEKLKESAKRKKEAKAAAETTSVVGDRIDEDPEAEAEAEKDDLRSH